MLRFESRARAFVMLAAALSGCNTIDQARQDRQQQDLEVARQSCVTAGAADGTPEFSRCVETEMIRIADRRQRTLEQLNRQSLPSYVQPSVPNGRMCLPTAAGAGGPSFTCI